MDADELLPLVARGDQKAFEELYGLVSGPVYGLVRRVLRDREQSEEVAQEVLLELWRTAARFDPARGTALAWILTLAHRRAVDRVRSARAAGERERREAERAVRAERTERAVRAERTERTERAERAVRAESPALDQVAEEVGGGPEREETGEGGLEREWVRRCLERLTDLQHQAVTLAYYDGYTYREVARRLSLPLGTVKSRMRDGLTRLRDCMGATA
ncbi:RNA polymerase sigma factor SigK [Streptomyces aureoverticillatus]|nr:RNA polymerase sigma factor SigK [Streptomyces aureoverticillatus]